MTFRLFSVLFLSCFILSSCKNINVEITEEGEDPYLLGKINRSGLEGPNYIGWFQQNYEDYELDMETVAKLKTDLGDYEILIFLGTWCEDSQREVPRFYKILDEVEFPEKQLRVVALSGQDDFYKQSPGQEEVGLNIEYVPTFVIYNNGVEVDRIIETPYDTLEKDLLNIIIANNN